MKHFSVWEIQECLYSKLKRYNVVVMSEGPENQEAKTIRCDVESVVSVLHDLGIRVSVLWCPDTSLCFGVAMEGRYKALGEVRRRFITA